MIQASDFQGNIYDIPIQTYPDGMIRIDHSSVPKNLCRLALRCSSALGFYAMLQLRHALALRSRHVPVLFASFPGARQDRHNEVGDYLNTAVCNLDLLHGAEFTVLDPHSLTVASQVTRIIEAANCISAPWGKYAAVIAPDAGASKRAELVAKKLGVPLFQAWKRRNVATGKLSDFGMEAPTGVAPGSKVLVVDDICDGGGTFNGLVDSLRYDFDYHLWVTHGYFTQGLTELKQRFSHIYTTDSIKGAPRDGVIEIPIVAQWLKGEI